VLDGRLLWEVRRTEGAEAVAKSIARWLRSLLLYAGGSRRHRIASELQGIVQTGTILGESRMVRAFWSPEHNRLREVEPVVTGTVDYALVAKAVVSPNRRGGYVLHDRSLFPFRPGLPGIPKLFFQGTSVGQITGQEGATVWVDRRVSSITFSRAIFAGSMAPHNWFHWTIDNLPNFFASRQLPSEFADWPLLVPEEGLSRRAWREAFELAIGDRPYIPVASDQLYSVDRLIVMERITSPSPRLLGDQSVPRIAVHSQGMRDFGSAVVGRIDAQTKRSAKLLFLTRDDDNVRTYNQEDALSLAETYGFAPVSLKGVSLVESAAMFQEADAIIGPHGAGWAGLLHAKPGLEVLFWSWEGTQVDNWYENLAHLSQVSFRRLSYRVDEKSKEFDESRDPRFSPYSLKLDVLENELKLLSKRISSKRVDS